MTVEEFFTAGVGVQIAILRHLELIRGQKEGTKIYIVPWNIGK
ncbi:MAG: hypothetical protein ACP5JW_04005 [Candidatus Bathyarchaeia archaeon]